MIKNWLAAGAFLMLLSGGGTALLRQAESGFGVIMVSMLTGMLVIGSAGLCRLLYYRFSVFHARRWEQEVREEKHQWWQRHCQVFALRDVVLIGPAGVEALDWWRVLQREQQPPLERQEMKGRALRIGRTFSGEPEEREKQLARMLALQWLQQCVGSTPDSPERCYWQGSDAAWEAFVTQLAETCPALVLPLVPERWQGEETLGQLAAWFGGDAGRGPCLLAGCLSLSAATASLRPAGEAAVLWIADRAGAVTLCRGEVFHPSPMESLPQVCERALQQSDLAAVPESCMLFSHPHQPELAESGWNVTHHLQDSYWGDVGKMDAMVVISLAAVFAQYQHQPCGWIATDPLYPLALGVVKPYG